MVQLLAEAFWDLPDACSMGVCRHPGFAPQGGPTGPCLEGDPRHKKIIIIIKIKKKKEKEKKKDISHV